MRLATYNVEWFSNLFDDDAQILNDGGWSGRQDVTRQDQLAALRVVFRALDADGIMIIEAPDSHARRSGTGALEAFAAFAGLRATDRAQRRFAWPRRLQRLRQQRGPVLITFTWLHSDRRQLRIDSERDRRKKEPGSSL